jgi:sporulation-control protein spo0M
MKKLTLLLFLGALALSVNSQIVVPLTLPDNCNISTGKTDVPLKETTPKLTVSPNPNDGTFTLQIKSHKVIDNVRISIFNSLGVECYAQRVYCNSNTLFRQLDVSGLPSGVYYVKASSGSYDLNASFIIQK